MAWLPALSGGYLLQCDNCGHIRGSYDKVDGLPTQISKGSISNRRKPFAEKRLPVNWLITESGTLCPLCVQVRNRETVE